jgi:hypothetical protein
VILAVFAALVTARGAFAEERYDHRGAVGLLVGSGFEYASTIGRIVSVDTAPSALFDLGVTTHMGLNSNELKLFARASFIPGVRRLSLVGGYRGYFGDDRVKTFFDLDLALRLLPQATLGPRVGLGVQYELTPVLGLYAGLGGQIGVGPQLARFSGELLVGFQGRSYLLE